MKKILALLLAAALLLMTAACGTRGKSGTLTGEEAEAFIQEMEKKEEEMAAAIGVDLTLTVDTAKAGDVEMRYMRFGKGEKTMVILPGLSVFHVTDSADAVAAGFENFTSEYTVYLFDVKENVPEGYTLRQMAEDTVAVFNALALKDICLYGVSMGGMMSLYIAGEYPGLVKRLVLGSAGCKANETSNGELNEWIRLAKEGDRTALGEEMASHIYSESVCEAYGSALYAGYETLSDEELTRFIRNAGTLLDYDFTEQTAKITCPVLAMGSKGDRVLTSGATEELAALCGGEVFLYDESFGHAVYDEAPDFKDRILAFFES